MFKKIPISALLTLTGKIEDLFPNISLNNDTFANYSEKFARMKYEFEKYERYAVLKLEEENLNSVVAPELKTHFVQYAMDGVESLILDLSNVAYVDSSGLSAILTANRIWSEINGSFVLTGLKSKSVEKLIQISRLDTILTIIPTLPESVDFVMMEALERDLNGDLETGT
jgi:anti-sigma B factor antagonist